MKCYKCNRQLKSYGVEQETGECKFSCDGEKCRNCLQRFTEKYRGICVKPCYSPEQRSEQMQLQKEKYAAKFNVTFKHSLENEKPVVYNFAQNPPKPYTWMEQ